MKKFLSLLLVMLLAISLVGCNTPVNSDNEEKEAQKEETKIRDGVYEGTGIGKGGEIKVSVNI